MTWKLEEAKSRLEEVLDSSLEDGPQVVLTDRGAFVVVPQEEWARTRRRTAKEVVLSPNPSCEDMMIPERGHLRHRETIDFE